MCSLFLNVDEYFHNKTLLRLTFCYLTMVRSIDHLELYYNFQRCCCKLRCQSGLKSGGRGSGRKKINFLKKSKHFDFFSQFHKEIDFSEEISQKFLFFQVVPQKMSFQGKFPKNF